MHRIIKKDDLTGENIIALLTDHLENMAKHSPPESRHALDLDGLKQPEITFWSVWDDGELVGCGALKELDPLHGEIKSMKTSSLHLRKGVAKELLSFILQEARRRGYVRLSLETGSMDAFEPARNLYQSVGFTYCEPFANYKKDPHSFFMTIEL
jgi:putative acetyltransferase